MKFLTLTFSVLLVCSSHCFSADVLQQHGTHGHKRSLTSSQEIRGEPQEKMTRHLEGDSRKKDPLDSRNIHERIGFKSDTLSQELPKVLSSLDAIYLDLQKIARAHVANNFERASELAALASGIKSLSNSTRLVLGKLQSKDYATEQVLLNASLAIGASGALKDQIDRTVEFLAKSEDTHGINCDVLKAASKAIQGVTKDIDMADFRLTDGKE